MGLTLPIHVKSNGDGEPIDWPSVKAAIIARLNLVEEYKKLGVKFPNTRVSEKGWISCHAVGRDDNIPSAAIHIEKGIYTDSGGEGTSKSFFNFALDHGGYSSWMNCLRHFAGETGVEISNVVRGGEGMVLEAIHDYLDADGRLSYGVWKYRLPTGSKTFRQYPWRGGQWIKEKGCMEGVDPLPYRLPELIAAPRHEVVLFLEGEKDVDRAYENGFVATTSHMGGGKFHLTGAKFLEAELAPVRDYAVIPDNDPVGRKHALDVATAMHAYLNGEAVVKVVPLPDLPHKGDLSDWFDLGGTADELRALIAAAPKWEPGMPVEAPTPEVDHEDPEDPEGDCTIEDLARHVSESAWAWDGWIPSSALTLLAAEAGAGKTRLMMDLHRRAYHGEPWPDDAAMNLPPGGKVLWIVADNHHEQMVMEAKAFGLFGMGALVVNTKRSEPFGGTTLVTDDDLAGLEARIRRNTPYWVVIDTITNTGDFKIQDAVDAKRQYKPLQEIAQRTKTPIICVTHTNASGKVLGRRAIEKVRVVILFSEPDRQGQPDRRKLWVEKSFAQKPPPRGVTVLQGKYEYDSNPPEEPDRPEPSGGGRQSPKADAIARWLEELLGAGGQAVTEIIDLAEAQGFSKPTLYRAKDKVDIHEFEAGGRKHWQLNIPD